MKMNAIYYLFAILLVSCSEDTTENEVEETVSEEQMTMEQLIDRKVRTELSIPATENFNIDILKEQLNDDEFEDAIVVVNRKEFTMQSAAQKNMQKQQEEVAYFGNHNHLFYYDGLSHTVTRKITIPSNGLIPLKVNFENIQTEAYKDFTIDVRIREARYRNFYTVRNGVPALLFQWKIHDIDENGKFFANHIQYDKGSHSLAKDILVFKADILSPIPKDLTSEFEIVTKPKGEMEYRFFYHPKEKKYFTEK